MEFNRRDLFILRNILGLTQRQFGFMIDRSQALITAWENGKRPLGRKAQAEIKRRFEVTDELHLSIRALSDHMARKEDN